MVRTEGEGGKRLNTNCGDSNFVVSLGKKKKRRRFSSAFSHCFFYLLLFDFIVCYYLFISVLFIV